MIDRLDHIVLTTKDKARCIAFYVELLGMQLETFGEGRIAFKFGQQKINLHEYGKEFLPKAHLPTPGSLDLCFIVGIALDLVIARLQESNWPIEQGPVLRTGAVFKLRSIYLRDPDLNLIEISERVE